MGSMNTTPYYSQRALRSLVAHLRHQARTLGFQEVRIGHVDPGEHAQHLQRWLAQGSHGGMAWMAERAELRCNPARLVPGAQRVISVRMNYYPPATADPQAVLAAPHLAYISRYALGRDYHKVIRRRLQTLADHLTDLIGPFGYRAFTDSAPILEKGLAEQCGLGWIGKNTNLLTRQEGSWFFIGELLTDLPLPLDPPTSQHCGQCQACLAICPTQAFRGPYDLDARRCIAYLTIEHTGSIPEALRPLLGNRIYGCDDCQWICPWNRFARPSQEPDFAARHHLDQRSLVELMRWEETEFLTYTQGMAIRRIGYERWLRNLAVALGNGTNTPEARAILAQRATHPSALVREHVAWAQARLA